MPRLPDLNPTVAQARVLAADPNGVPIERPLLVSFGGLVLGQEGQIG